MRRRTSPALLVVLALLGFLLVTAAQTASANRRAAEPRKARLITLIEQRRDQIKDLDAAIDDLRADVSVASRRRNTSDAAARAATEREAVLSAQAGASALRGRGLDVRLSDSDRVPVDAEEAGAYRISDIDLQLVINALFAAGAEGVAVNANRVVATTSVRAAGDTIVVNFRPLTPPYRVAAIGADRKAFEDSEIAERMRRWRRLFGLGFSVRAVESTTVPSYAGRVGISVGSPIEGAG
ncbi:MAG TPA: DUF881 domain-containing protein [Acidimicrobiales bacterium]|nr:DUF881 domain-containing protein [Acidimicrobiales bacterium]